MRGGTGKRRRLQKLLLLAPLLAGGCMPHVLHSPRVEPGTTGSISLMAGRNLAAGDDRDASFVPSLYAGIRRGFISRDGRAGLLLGVQASPLLPLFWLDTDGFGEMIDIAAATSYLDVYAQPTGARGTHWDAGGGALLSSASFAPYVQLGHRSGGRHGWYITPMVIFTREPLEADGLYWAPSIAWRDAGSGGSTAINIDFTTILPSSSEADWFFLLTFTAELGVQRRAGDHE